MNVTVDYTATGGQIIERLKEIVAERQWHKINGQKVDVYAAAAIVTVYEAMPAEERKEFLTMPVLKMANVAYAAMG